MTDYHTPRFKSSEVAAAAGMALNTFRSHFRRGNFRMIGDARHAEVHGLPHLFSLRDAMLFAVAVELITAGIEAASAFNAAATFAHTGTEERLPAMVFDPTKGMTLLIYHGRTNRARIICTPLQSHLATLFHNDATGQREAATIVLLNDVERRVFTRLGIADQ